jgi:two-component system NtrC family sensor kinase
VPSTDKTRALGTRVSAEVRKSVLEQGETWIASAFVVNDWYVSAYEPILDVAGNKVGMLYAGYLQEPYRLALQKGIALISAMLIGGSLLAIAAAVHGAQSMFKPVEAIARVIRATALGERRRIGKIDSADEIGELAGQFDYMLDTLEQNQSRIENDAMQLEEKVHSRTAELEQQNHRLQESILLVHETRQRLAMAEKLAALGQLTAGVAHEINNPTAVILGNMDILIEEIGEARSSVEVEIDLIIAQVYRIRSITDRLLQYSRPGSDSSQLEMLGQAGFVGENPQIRTNNVQPVERLNAVSPSGAKPILDINQAIKDSLHLVSHELDSKSIGLELNCGVIVNVAVDLQEFQQVLVNLITNAIDAVEQEGRIWVSTGSDESFVWFEVKDDGVGIEEGDLQRVFDPFFTRGKERGTGLGLSVSYGIVSRYEGQIEVESRLRKGTVFTVIFPASDVLNEAGQTASSDLESA